MRFQSLPERFLFGCFWSPFELNFLEKTPFLDPCLLLFREKSASFFLALDSFELVNDDGDDEVQTEKVADDDQEDEVDSHRSVVVNNQLLIYSSRS